jgi:hypothetical protein
MVKVTYDKQLTALLLIDPYNDFISEGGKVWDRVRDVAEATLCVPHMLQVLDAARKTGLRVFYALHRRYRPGDYETWKSIAPMQKGAWLLKGLRRRHMGWRAPPRRSIRAVTSRCANSRNSSLRRCERRSDNYASWGVVESGHNGCPISQPGATRQ